MFELLDPAMPKAVADRFLLLLFEAIKSFFVVIVEAKLIWFFVICNQKTPELKFIVACKV